MGNTNFSLWGMGNLKTNIPQYSPQWGILGINPSVDTIYQKNKASQEQKD